jgi:hypothetical protein
LQGRNDRFVWGSLVEQGEPGGLAVPFRYDLSNRVLFRGEEEDQETFLLDEMGVIVKRIDG